MQSNLSNQRQIGFIADSSCDLTTEMRERMEVNIIPLKVIVAGNRNYNDDGSVDIRNMFANMRLSKEPTRSACPSVEEYRQAMRLYSECFVVTLSSKLSGSYNAACVAANIVLEDFPKKKIHVFDSQSAAAGETALFLYLKEQNDQGKSFEKIVKTANEHIKNTRTLFVLKDIGNLVRNGRLAKLPGLISSALSLYPILGDNGNGEIRFWGKERGIQRSLSRLVDMVKEMTKTISHPQQLVLSYCDCLERAEWLRQQLLERCSTLKDVILVPTGALSSMYAGEGGVVVAFSL